MLGSVPVASRISWCYNSGPMFDGIRASLGKTLTAKPLRWFVRDYLMVCLVTAAVMLLDWLIVDFPLESMGFDPEEDMWTREFMRPATPLWCISAVPSLYAAGFCTWSFAKMSMAYSRQAYRPGLWRSGWGHGWKMSALVLFTFVMALPRLLLFIVPGFVKLLKSELAVFVLVEHPDWPVRRCIDESCRLMDGNLKRLYCPNPQYIVSFVLNLVATMLPFAGKLFEIILTPGYVLDLAQFYDVVTEERPVV